MEVETQPEIPLDSGSESTAEETDKESRKRARMFPLNILQRGDAPNGGGVPVFQAAGDRRSLLYCGAKLWDHDVQFILDTGAALEGVLSADLLPCGVTPQPSSARVVRVGDGRDIWTEGEVRALVDFGVTKLWVNFTILRTSAFQALLAIDFLRRPEISGISFHPPRLAISGKEVIVTKGAHAPSLKFISQGEAF